MKVVHNGIEYGLMQAYAEGFDILRNAGADIVPQAQRFRSHQQNSFANKLLSAMREQFGGHVEPKATGRSEGEHD